MELDTGLISPNGKRVRICAAELGGALDLKLLDFQKGDNRTPDYLALNPMGKAPTLTDGEFVLWESPAILFYLARTSGNLLWPDDPRALADVLRWMFFGASHLDPYFTTLVVERLIKPRRGEATDPAQCAAAEQWLARFVPVVDLHLADRAFLTGQLSLADIALGCTLELSALLGYDLAPFPHLGGWLQGLQSRESWRAASTLWVKPPGTATRERFVAAYDAGVPPPWDIGGPQRDLAALFDELAIAGSAVDLGCGTGENVLELARRGLDAWGVDSTPAAIVAAEKKRDERGLHATFVTGDALDLAALGRTFDTVIDCGLFHVLTDDERRRYVRELDRVLRPGGRHLMLGFATNGSGIGPRGYSPEELRAHFAEGWREEFVRATTFETTGAGTQSAWVSSFVRTG